MAAKKDGGFKETGFPGGVTERERAIDYLVRVGNFDPALAELKHRVAEFFEPGHEIGAADQIETWNAFWGALGVEPLNTLYQSEIVAFNDIAGSKTDRILIVPFQPGFASENRFLKDAASAVKGLFGGNFANHELPPLYVPDASSWRASGFKEVFSQEDGVWRDSFGTRKEVRYHSGEPVDVSSSHRPVDWYAASLSRSEYIERLRQKGNIFMDWAGNEWLFAPKPTGDRKPGTLIEGHLSAAPDVPVPALIASQLLAQVNGHEVPDWAQGVTNEALYLVHKDDSGVHSLEGVSTVGWDIRPGEGRIIRDIKRVPVTHQRVESQAA